MQEYIKNLADIDTCNIHTLKSIAKSVDAEYLTDFIKETYPTQLINLINLLSIKKSILFDNFHVLNMSAIGPIVGNIDLRSTDLLPSKYYLSIINNIAKNIDKIIPLFEVNKLPYIEENLPIDNIEYSLCSMFDEDQLQSLFGFDKTNVKPYFYYIISEDKQQYIRTKKTIAELTLYDLIQTIKYFISQNQNTTNNVWFNVSRLPKSYFEESDFNDSNFKNLNSITKEQKEELINCINPFHILMQVFKGYLFNYNIKTFFQTMYIEKNTNVLINLTDLYCSIIETMQVYDENYINDFITFHFYGLFYDMIINQSLAKDWNGTNFIAKSGDYTYDEFCDLVKSYVTPEERDECIKKIIYYKKTHVDFIQYLSIINNILNRPSNSEDKSDIQFNYNILDFNCENPVVNSKEYRRLLGLDNSGNVDENKTDYILMIAREFTDICLQISYARENIKGLIQQYSFIGTNKIIKDIVREYFIKNFSNRFDWRYVSDNITKISELTSLSASSKRLIDENNILHYDDTVNNSNININIETLNGLSIEKPQFFDVDLVEYYDNTQYFNIYADLPSCIVGYQVSGQIEESSSYVTTSDIEYVSTWMVKDNLVSAQFDPPSGPIYWGILSTIYDNFNYLVPEDQRWPSAKMIDIIISGVVVSSLPYWDVDTVPTAVFIPSGTILSSITTVPAGSIVTSSYFVDNIVPITGLCATYVTDYNNQFWVRNFDKEPASSQLIQKEISFYENFFDELKNAKTPELKYEIYKTEVYPLLSAGWASFATSGFLSNPSLSSMQLKYSGQYPGQYLTQNHANKIFTTIAPMPYIRNLYENTGMYEETSLYLAKPFYENVAYYISLMTKEILNMQDYNNKTGYGIPKEGWRQSYIEFKGYNSYYENSKNLTLMSVVPSEMIDCDGPWVYIILEHFIKLYLDYKQHIPHDIIQNFVNKYYSSVTKLIKQHITDQLFKYQHEIYNKQYYKVYDFQYDQYDNQFTLYKHMDRDTYTDAGEIWIRMKNYPLSVPLMNYCKLPEERFGTYQDDIYDTLQCNQHIKYANMFKQLVNNAVQFGVFQNTLWVLGYSSYIELNNKLINSTSVPYLKLACVQFYRNEELNTLIVDTTTYKAFSLYNDQDNLDSIDQFIGQYFNQTNKSLEFVLYDKEKHINNLISLSGGVSTEISGGNLTRIPIRIGQYLLENTITTNYINMEISGIMPSINYAKQDTVNDFQTYKGWLSPKQSEEIYGNTITGNIENINHAVLTGIINYNGDIQYDITTNSPKIIGSWQFNDTWNYLDGDITEIDYDNNIITSNIVLYSDTLFGENSTTIKINNVIGNILEQHLYSDKEYISGIVTSQVENIWRLNSDYVDVNIGYEAFNPFISANYEDYINSNKQSVYVGVIQYNCELYNSKVSNTKNLYISGIKNIKCRYKSAETPISDKNDVVRMLLLNNKYPKCYLNSTGELVIESLITTLGGKKSCKYLPNVEDVDELQTPEVQKELDILKSTLISVKDLPSGAVVSSYIIDALTGTLLTGIINDYPLSSYTDTLNNTIMNNPASISSDLTWNNNGWGFNFYSTYEQYLLSSTLPNISRKDLNALLNTYNENLSSRSN